MSGEPPVPICLWIKVRRYLRLKLRAKSLFHVLSGSNSRDRSASLEAESSSSSNPLASVLPLDWLFSETDEPEPPSSPKQVQETPGQDGGEVNRNRTGSSSQGSSGTDNESKSLLPSGGASSDTPRSNEQSGAIPKQRRFNFEESDAGKQHADSPMPSDAEEGDFRQWRRRAFIRRESRLSQDLLPEDGSPPLDADWQLQSLEDPNESEANELKMRIIEVLSAPSNAQCERELTKLKNELENRRKRRQKLSQSREEQQQLPQTSNTATPSSGSLRQRHPLWDNQSPREQEGLARGSPRESLRRIASEEEARRERRRRRRAARRAERERRAAAPPVTNSSAMSTINSILGT